MRGFMISFAIISLLIVVPGCDEGADEEVVEGEGEPPPPTPDEIASSFETEVGLRSGRGGRVGPGSDPAGFVNAFNGFRTRRSPTPEESQNHKEAIRIVSRKVGDLIKANVAKESWEMTRTLCQGYKALNPDLPRHDQTLAKAEAELRKPVVTLKGLPELIEGEVTAMMEVYIPATKETFTGQKMRVGQELFGIRLEEIVGGNKGVVFTYLETGDRFRVFLPTAVR